jgi:hypothetical protein
MQRFCHLALLQLVFCLLYLLAASRSIETIDVPALFAKHTDRSDLGSALRLLKARILKAGDSEDHLEFAGQLYRLGRATDALGEFRHVPFALCRTRDISIV